MSRQLINNKKVTKFIAALLTNIEIGSNNKRNLLKRINLNSLNFSIKVLFYN